MPLAARLDRNQTGLTAASNRSHLSGHAPAHEPGAPFSAAAVPSILPAIYDFAT
jgi:hypothetical protein